MKSESEVAQLCLTLCDPMDCSPPGDVITIVCALLCYRAASPHPQNNLISLKLTFEFAALELVVLKAA